MPDPWPKVPCPPDCEIPNDLHCHYEREPGDYYRIDKPTACCGREFMRLDEFLLGGQCQWCFADGRPMPGVHMLVYPKAAARVRGLRKQRR